MNYELIVEKITQIDDVAQRAVARNINQLLTLRNWLVGAYIFEYEQNGEDRAVYAEQLLKKLSDDLSKRGHKGFSVTNLKYFREVSLVYPLSQIGQTVSGLFDNLLPILNLAETEQTQTAKIDDSYFQFLSFLPRISTNLPCKKNVSTRK
jgi:hypothetical protein